MSCIVGIHQPNYFPWPGFFAKMALCDVFILHDAAEFSKKYPIRRTYIQAAQHHAAKAWMTVPLRKHSDHARIADLLIDHSQPWANKHANMLYHRYRKGACFEAHYPAVQAWLQEAGRYDQLAAWNAFLILEIGHLLGVAPEIQYSTRLPATGSKSGYNLNLARQAGATHYVSGMGARAYEDETAFQQHHINLIYSDYYSFQERHPYPRGQAGFVNGLSVLDALFYTGAGAIRERLLEYKKTLLSHVSHT